MPTTKRKKKPEPVPTPEPANPFGENPWLNVSLGAGVSFSVSWTIAIAAACALFSINFTDGDVDLLDGLIALVFSLAGG